MFQQKDDFTSGYNLDQSVPVQKNFVSNVFGWMFGALIITAVVAFLFGTNMELLRLMFTETGYSTLGYFILFAPIGLVMIMSFAINKLSVPVLTGIFILYSALMGASLGFIFVAYQLGTIFLAFVISAGMFAVMAILGYTTSMDLTRFGSIMIMGLIGVVIAALVNIFMKSSMLDMVISIATVVVFTGLIAYDIQRIKKYGQIAAQDAVMVKKMTIMGALNIYLDFINLFLAILKLLGRRN